MLPGRPEVSANEMGLEAGCHVRAWPVAVTALVVILTVVVVMCVIWPRQEPALILTLPGSLSCPFLPVTTTQLESEPCSCQTGELLRDVLPLAPSFRDTIRCQ